MSINLVVAVTDSDWFEALRDRPDLSEVNFWAPSGAPFRALKEGELLLFKLHSPRNFIVGGGVYTYSNTLPCSLAWESFGESNGASSLVDMRQRIAKYRRTDVRDRSDFPIGCRILTRPFFLSEDRWLPVPSSWSKNIVSFKTYSTDDPDGASLWEAVSGSFLPTPGSGPIELQRFGTPQLISPRLGQGAFRVLITDLYRRSCAVTRERTLPALEAAHIRPYGDGGAHQPSNGLLLRRDIHSLFDAGYVTITPGFRFEVSRRIKEEFNNGKHYYELHGSEIALPDDVRQRPAKESLDWHNENCYRE